MPYSRETQVHLDQNSVSRKNTSNELPMGCLPTHHRKASRNLLCISSACDLCWSKKFLKFVNFTVREFFGYVFVCFLYVFPLTLLSLRVLDHPSHARYLCPTAGHIARNDLQKVFMHAYWFHEGM